MAAAAAGLSDRAMAEALRPFGISMSYETFRQVKLGNRGARYSELQAIAEIVSPHVEPEVGDALEWLLAGLYNGPDAPSVDGANPRYLKPQPDVVTNVIDLDAARRRRRDQGRTAHSL